MVAPFTTSDPGDEALTAFHGALGSVEIVRKTNTADTGKYTYTYADLTDVLGEVKRVCDGAELRPFQVSTADDGDLAVVTTLLHSSGQWITFAPTRLPMLRDPQALGGAITYLRRYALVSIFAMAVDDDDGKAATEQTRHQQATGSRSGAEERIRAEIKSVSPDVRAMFMTEFKTAFGMPLLDLPVSKHGEALGWTLSWLAEPMPAGVDPESEAGQPNVPHLPDEGDA
jgi:hypothetical protein